MVAVASGAAGTKRDFPRGSALVENPLEVLGCVQHADDFHAVVDGAVEHEMVLEALFQRRCLRALAERIAEPIPIGQILGCRWLQRGGAGGRHTPLLERRRFGCWGRRGFGRDDPCRNRLKPALRTARQPYELPVLMHRPVNTTMTSHRQEWGKAGIRCGMPFASRSPIATSENTRWSSRTWP
jgi:hypothetical protein